MSRSNLVQDSPPDPNTYLDLTHDWTLDTVTGLLYSIFWSQQVHQLGLSILGTGRENASHMAHSYDQGALVSHA